MAKNYQLIELDDVEKYTSKILNITNINKIDSDKLFFADADILTTKLRPYLGKSILNNFDDDTLGTTEWIPLKINDKKIIKEYKSKFNSNKEFNDLLMKLLEDYFTSDSE